jgi:hypothetical protein
MSTRTAANADQVQIIRFWTYIYLGTIWATLTVPVLVAYPSINSLVTYDSTSTEPSHCHHSFIVVAVFKVCNDLRARMIPQYRNRDHYPEEQNLLNEHHTHDTTTTVNPEKPYFLWRS